MQLTNEQHNFVSFLRENTTENVAVVANAGSGKSSTAANYVNGLEGVHILICSFSKQACESIQSKLDYHKATTIHAFCRSTILKSKKWRTINIDTYKYKNILKQLVSEGIDIFCNLTEYDKDMVLSYVDYLREYTDISFKPSDDDLYKIAKSDFADQGENFSLLELAEEFTDDPTQMNEFYAWLAKQILHIYNNPNVFDFIDLLWYVSDPNNTIVFEPYKEFLLDEAQDLSPLQVKVIKRFIAETNARFIMIGDPNQCIYEFMGASISTFYDLADYFNCKRFELTECFRVPDKLLDLAREYVPSITSNIQNLDNAGSNYTTPEFLRNNETAFLFRTNSDLFKVLAYVHEMGLTPIINCTFKPWKAYYAAVHLKLSHVNDDTELARKFFHKTESGVVLRIFSNMLGITDLKELVKAIKTYLEDQNGKRDNANCKLILSTIHRAKGAEFDYVVVYMDKPERFHYSVRTEENNLFYVGVTRAKKGLQVVGNL